MSISDVPVLCVKGLPSHCASPRTAPALTLLYASTAQDGANQGVEHVGCAIGIAMRPSSCAEREGYKFLREALL